jgi:hypothetical protein
MPSIAIALFATLGLLASMLVGPAPADAEAEAAACERTCDDIESSTDRRTCKLQCRPKAEGGTEVIRWKQTRLLGGSPEGGENAGGTTTTITTSDAKGTSSTTTTVHTYGEDATPGAAVRTTPPAAKADPYAVLAACQAACNPIAVPGERASCKLRCLYPSKMRATAATMTPAPTRGKAPAGTKAAVGPGAAPGTPAPKATPAPAAKPVANPADAARCRSACATKLSACRETCGGSGSDAATCRLQCDGTADRCRDEC